MIFFDFETFRYDWLLVTFNGKEFTRIENDRNKLLEYYEQHKSDLWVGYNCKGYDQYIMKAIILGINPKLVNDFIIREHKPGWAFSDEFKNIEFNIYDCMVFGKSLKQLESYMGVNIHETEVSFDIDRPLTDEEKELNYKYCKDDVYNTALVFNKSIEEFEASLGLCKLAGEPLSSLAKTKAQLAAKILGAKRLPQAMLQEEWNFALVDTVENYNYDHPEIIEWFRTVDNDRASLDVELCGVPTTFALGGLHGALRQYKAVADEQYIIIHSDVGSLYPSIMLRYNLLTRAIPDIATYQAIKDTRMELKRKKDPLQKIYKRVLNSTYGLSGAGRCVNGQYKAMSDAYDPRRMREVCINGQLLILQLIEDVDAAKLDCVLIQENTDGLIYKLNRKDLDQYLDICKTWEERTGLSLEHDYTTLLVQRDVNNYIAVFDNGKIERKGGVVKEPTELDYDLPIIKNAIVRYFVDGAPVERTIMDESNLMPFMKTYKLSGKYHHCEHNGEVLSDKVYRVFASRSRKDGIVYKVKEGGNPEKFAGCPDHAKIVNGDIRGESVPTWLDRQWYIDYAKKEIDKFL